MADWDYEIVDAYYFEIGFSTSGWRVLKDLKKKNLSDFDILRESELFQQIRRAGDLALCICIMG